MITLVEKAKNCLFLLFFFKVEPTGFSDWQEVECVGKRSLKDDFKAFDLRKWKDGVAINWDGKNCKKKMFGVVVIGVEEFTFVLADFEMGIRYTSGDADRQLYLWIWNYEFSQLA